jgi:hypothetical protein
MKAHDAAAGTAQLALQRLDSHHRCMKMLLEKLSEDVHRCQD